MASHRASRPRRAPRNIFGSGRFRAILSLGLVLGLGVSGTLAYWTDEVQITGTTFTAATLDINVNGSDPYAGATVLSMADMVPGNSSAQVLTVNNTGTAPAKYTLVGGLSGGSAAAYNSAGANGLLLTIRQGGTKSGTGNTSTCTGGTVLGTADTPLTNNVNTSILAKRPTSPLAASGGSESLCFQIRLAATAPSSLQGLSTTAQFTATGTSDVS